MVEANIFPFKPGNKVKCINDQYCKRIKKGHVYIVRNIIGNKYVTLHKVHGMGSFPTPKFMWNKFILVTEYELIEFI